MATSVRDALRGLRAARNRFKDLPSPTAAERALKRRLNVQIVNLAEAYGLKDPSDDDTLEDHWQTCRDMVDIDPSLWDEDEFRTAFSALNNAKAGLPEDDEDPKVLDQKKIRLMIKRLSESTAPEHADFLPTAIDYAERHFDIYSDARPIESILAPAVATLEDQTATPEQVIAAAAELRQNADRLQRPSKA